MPLRQNNYHSINTPVNNEMASVPYSQINIDDSNVHHPAYHSGNDNAVEIFNPLLSETNNNNNKNNISYDFDNDLDLSATNTNHTHDPLELSGISLPSRKSIEFDLNNVHSILEELPQGRNYGVYSSVIFIISRIIGSGIFSTPGGIFRNCGGSPFLFFLAWLIATLISFLCMIVYLELGTLMPRSGGPKFFLETIYRRPKYLVTTIMSLQMVLFGFTCSNAMIFGQYILSALGYEVDIAKLNASRYVGLGIIFACAVVQSLSVKTSVYVQNGLGVAKLSLLAILVLTGFYVIVVPSSITHLENQLHWSGFFQPVKPVTLSSFTAAILQAIFSFNGWESIYLISSEVKNPIRTLKIVGPLSLLITLFTYLFVNIAYLKVIDHTSIFGSGQLIGSLLFEKVFGKAIGKQLLAISVALSAAGNVYVVLYGISRSTQEVFREGILPFSKTMAANFGSWGTPVPTIFLSMTLSAIILLVPPPGDVFSYIVNLETYLLQLVFLAVMFGFFKLRRDYPHIARPIRAPVVAPIVAIGFIGYVLITPLFEGNGNEGDSSGINGLPNYSYLAIFLNFLYVTFWFVKFVVLPKLGGYKLQRQQEVLSDGLMIKTWSKLYN